MNWFYIYAVLKGFEVNFFKVFFFQQEMITNFIKPIFIIEKLQFLKYKKTYYYSGEILFMHHMSVVPGRFPGSQGVLAVPRDSGGCERSWGTASDFSTTPKFDLFKRLTFLLFILFSLALLAIQETFILVHNKLLTEFNISFLK